MTREHLQAANRALLDAIETPPETGMEAELDDLAEQLWYLATEKERPPDQGRLERVQYRLTVLREQVHGRRSELVARAIDEICACREQAQAAV
ncbi:DUF7553 family protein [Halorientalis regularis]|jgi:hypothetical protein|uniref:Uncharacterized protein n=1 Tax=Halorientalis regularis TaxID=660518 RepID=A0A1G7FCF4_9EURY|nr:hypothetical protein [Halorientalis regularis]SDE73572.1 hypothetical protein SAMN05216218_101127 [Halorientalis regularis]